MTKFIFLLLLATVAFSNENIDVNLKDLSIEQLIKITSKTIKKDILVPNKIKGKVNYLSNAPMNRKSLLTLLKSTLASNGYSLVESDGILKVVKKERRVVPSSSRKTLKRKKEVVHLLNIEVKELEDILKSLCSNKKERILVAANEVLNLVVLDGLEEEVDGFKALIKKLDRQKEQVYVKAKILELDDNMLEDIGFQFGILKGRAYSGGLYSFSTRLNSGQAISIDTASIGLEIPNVSSVLALGATLNLLNRTYALDILSEPSILCLNNKEGVIYVGERISMQTGLTVTDGGNQTITYEREDIGLTLKVKPRVFKEKKVSLQINTLLENIKNREFINSNPDTTKKQIITEAIVNNGESVVIGGLNEKRNEKNEERVPYISEVPLLGELFKNRSKTLNSKNLIVIITPYIVPKNRDLTYVREELAKLKVLEDKFLEEVLINLRKKEEIAENSSLTDEQRHKKIVEEYFGI